MGFVIIDGEQVLTSFLNPRTEEERQRLKMYQDATYETPQYRPEVIEWMKQVLYGHQQPHTDQNDSDCQQNMTRPAGDEAGDSEDQCQHDE